MKIGMVSDSLAGLTLLELLQWAGKIGIKGIEFNSGNWSTAPHFSTQALLESASAREEFTDLVSSHKLEIIALNCNGNQLHPVVGRDHDRVVRDTIRLSGLLGLTKVCLMSGLPAGNATDRTANWIVSSWPPENRDIVDWQWRDRLVPYWHELVKFAGDHGVDTLAVEMHGSQLVYSPRTLMRLREEVGPVVAANLDPSHLMWMGADPIAAVDYLGEAIRHVHGKDTLINAPVAATSSLMEYGPLDNIDKRSWSHCTLGYGHDKKWWADFCYRLQMTGYDGWISIEHEDVNLSRLEGLRKAVTLLQDVGIAGRPDYIVQDI